MPVAQSENVADHRHASHRSGVVGASVKPNFGAEMQSLTWLRASAKRLLRRFHPKRLPEVITAGCAQGLFEHFYLLEQGAFLNVDDELLHFGVLF